MGWTPKGGSYDVNIMGALASLFLESCCKPPPAVSAFQLHQQLVLETSRALKRSEECDPTKDTQARAHLRESII